jgi:hypothetical protein
VISLKWARVITLHNLCASPLHAAVPRCLLPGRPTVDCLFRDVNHDGTTALKVWNMNRCGGVVAAFNVQASGGGGGVVRDGQASAASCVAQAGKGP